ncbi:MAG: SRPBCC domain-containing protein [Verrucomicrobiaceae bacterium]|nr:SRPBCC domain-containing protein [Verrucomicrobiaceae bacterium]
MNNPHAYQNNDHGTLINTAEVRFVRILPGPIERVWAFITDPEKRQLWLAGGTSATTPGSSFQLQFENRRHELPGETVPDKHKEHACVIGSEATITRHEPPHVHAFIWGEGEVIFELSPQDDQVKLVLTHRKLPNNEELLGVSGGWHIHLTVLVSKLTGTPQPPFWSTLVSLEEQYTSTFDLREMDPSQGFCSALFINTPAQTVYNALVTEAGLKGWWTQTCDIGLAEGALSTFRFDDTWKTMRIEKLKAASEVRWRCVDSSIDLEDGSKSSEWIDTSCVFHLIPISDHTTALQFQHLGLHPDLECYPDCKRGWTRFLNSLKHYVETGIGEPY